MVRPEIKEIQRKREGRIFKAFKGLNVDVSGNPNHPMIVFDRTKYINTYIKNFDLKLLSKFVDLKHDHEVILEYKLTRDVALSINDIKAYLLTEGYTRVYPVKLKDTDLFLAGWNFKDKFLEKGKYPVFAKYGCKYYLDKDVANDVVENYSTYDLEVI